MKILYSSSLLEVTQLKDALENENIPSFIRNEISSGLSGELPLSELTPELWVQNDEDLARAIQIKDDWKATPKVVGENWVCKVCGETSEPQFTSCWNCGAPRP